MEDKEAPRGSSVCQHRIEVLPDELMVHIHQVSIVQHDLKLNIRD